MIEERERLSRFQDSRQIDQGTGEERVVLAIEVSVSVDRSAQQCIAVLSADGCCCLGELVVEPELFDRMRSRIGNDVRILNAPLVVTGSSYQRPGRLLQNCIESGAMFLQGSRI